MAVNPYFTFADPALQQAVVQEAQVQAALQAAQEQRRAQTLAALRQERQQRADLEERRAIREGDIRRLDAQEAERRRQFDVQTGLTREDIASREKIAGARSREIDNRDLYNNLLKIVEGDDPPTLMELEARMIDLSDAQRKTLLDRRNSVAAAKKLQFTQSVNEANRLRGLIGTVKDGKTLTADDVLRGSQWRNVLQVTPDGLGFQSLLTPPREDATPDTPTFHVPIGRPPADTEIPVEGIGDIQRRLSGPARQPGLLEGYGRALLDLNIHPLARLVNRFFVPPLSGAGPAAGPPMRVPEIPAEAGPMGFAPRYTAPTNPSPDYLPFAPEY